jgi:radical SAM protein with 4Fe4S-binding SPASM domain
MSYVRHKQRNSELLRDDIRSKHTVFRGLPEIVNLNHTDVCNLRCIMCFQAYTPGRNTIPLDRVREILDELLPTARKLKLTTAGEPVLGPFAEIVDRARHYGCRLELITNATRLTPERFAMMEDILDQIVISLDSHELESLEHIRGKGVHKRIMDNLAALGEYLQGKPRSFISAYHIVLMTSNVPLLADFVRFARTTGVDRVKVLRMHYMTEKLKQDEDPFVNFTREELDRHVHEAQRVAREVGMNLTLGEVGYDDVDAFPVRAHDPPLIPTYCCNMLMQEVYVYPTEEIFPCCIPSAALRMGTLKEKSFPEIWNGRGYRRLRRQMFSQKLEGACSGCKIYGLDPEDSAFDFVPGAAPGRSRAAFDRLAARIRGTLKDHLSWPGRNRTPIR